MGFDYLLVKRNNTYNIEQFLQYIYGFNLHLTNYLQGKQQENVPDSFTIVEPSPTVDLRRPLTISRAICAATKTVSGSPASVYGALPKRRATVARDSTLRDWCFATAPRTGARARSWCSAAAHCPPARTARGTRGTTAPTWGSCGARAGPWRGWTSAGTADWARSGRWAAAGSVRGAGTRPNWRAGRRGAWRGPPRGPSPSRASATWRDGSGTTPGINRETLIRPSCMGAS